jgi:hypothetical protein
MATRKKSERVKNASSRKRGFAREQARRSAAQIGQMLDAVNTCATMLLQFGVWVYGVAGMRGTTRTSSGGPIASIIRTIFAAVDTPRE